MTDEAGKRWFRIELSDNAFGAVLVFSIAVAMASMAYCQSVESRVDAEVRKAQVQAGLCLNGWGIWSKCR